MTTTDFESGDTSAVSLDGRHFRYRGGVESAGEPGRFVVLRTADGSAQLGQVDDVVFTTSLEVTGEGRIFGTITVDGRELDVKRSQPFTNAIIAAASAETIELLYRGAGVALPIGSHADSPDIPARLLPQRFNRHTFWCGQSGSGKTYALGVVLEQLLVHTALPMLIFDPNADFVRLRETVQGTPGRARSVDRDVLDSRDIRVLRPSGSGGDPLLVRFTDLPLPAKGAVLRLHPIDDREEYNELVRIEESVGTLSPDRIVPTLLERATDAAGALAARIENLRIIDWEVWAGDRTPVTEIIDQRPDATVLDLGGFSFADESLVIALAVLGDLWAKRETRRPLLIVIDEAHNLTSPGQGSPLRAAVRELIIQIAAEGRKFGLWLLLSTQRPSRVHPSIISQCDNLALMKMASPADLAELGTIFGFVPPAMLARAPRFRQGEALFVGGFVPAPTFVRMGDRLTRESGTDVEVPVRKSPRP